jgi:hypothetical protein
MLKYERATFEKKWQHRLIKHKRKPRQNTIFLMTLTVVRTGYIYGTPICRGTAVSK